MAGQKERAYDAYLVASIRIGDRQAWRLLVERWQPRFLGHAWRLLGDADLAAEAAQDAWIDVLRGIAGLDDAQAFPAWALRIVSRRCAKLIKRLQRKRETDRALAGERETDTDTEENGAEQAADIKAVRKVLSELSADHRAVIGLFYLEEMSVAEVSVVLDIPPGTVKTRLMHARKRLREKLEGENNEQD